ncbi:hypothetical protein [Porphyrobacter sp. HT-58-2]|uniref:hypothetical protein n=1 Tax=Porphyrobacter sp. HT-58-2 TaxID=2023229 RepID=UPI001F355DE3|nr:hypothetical protein [Porphyrobacter sp. HT-58-2]
MKGLPLIERLRRMNQRSLFGEAATSALPEGETEDAGAAGTLRTESLQRVQVGLFGIAAMVFLVGLASVIGGQADRIEELAVPEAAPTTEPSVAPTQANPLADAGVVPDIVAEPSPSPALPPLDLPPPRPAGTGNASPQP